MAQKETVNTFTGGMVMDTHPLTTPNNVLTNCLNGTLVTFNGNEMILQNDLGNAIICSEKNGEKNGDLVKLPDGFVPVGTTEKGGIVYIASYNPNTKECQLGSFPSPERNITSDESNFPQNEFRVEYLYIDELSKGGKNRLISGSYNIPLSDIIVKTGDLFKLTIDRNNEENQSGYNIKLIATTDYNEIVDVLDTIEDSNEYKYYSGKNGKFSLIITPDKIDTFEVSYQITKGYYYKYDGNNLYQIDDDDILYYNADENVIIPYTKYEEEITDANKYIYLNSDYIYVNIDNNNVNLYNWISSKIEFSVPEKYINNNCFEGIIVTIDGIDQYISKYNLTTAKILLSNNELQIIVYPVVTLGYIDELKQTFNINISNLIENQSELKRWKYYVYDDKLLLSFGFDGYYTKQEELHSIKLYYIRYENINTSDFDSNFTDDNCIKLLERESYIGRFYDYIYFTNSEQNTYPKQLDKDCLYLIKICYYIGNDENVQGYRWLYTCKVFNDLYSKYQGEDFNELYLDLELVPELNTYPITTDNISTQFNENLLNDNNIYTKIGVTKNNFNSRYNLISTITFKNDYNLFSLLDLTKLNFTYDISKGELITPSTDDVILKSYQSSENSSNNNIYSSENEFHNFYDDIEITEDNLGYILSGTINNKIYCNLIRDIFYYSSVIAPLVYDYNSAEKYNLIYDSTKHHFLNNYFVVLQIEQDPYEVLNDKKQRTHIYWYVGQLQNNKLELYRTREDVWKTNDEVSIIESNLTDKINSLFIDTVQEIVKKSSYTTLLPIIIISDACNQYENDETEDHSFFMKRDTNGNWIVINSKTNVIIDTNSNEDIKNLIRPVLVSLACKDDEGRNVLMNAYEKIEINQIISKVDTSEIISEDSINYSDYFPNYTSQISQITYADFIFNVLNQIYVNYEPDTDCYRKFGYEYVNIVDNIYTLGDFYADLKLNITSSIKTENNEKFIFKIKNKEIINDTFNGNINLNNININKDLCFSFQKEITQKILVKDNLKPKYDLLRSFKNQTKIRILNCNKNISLYEDSLNKVNIDSPLLIKYVNGLYEFSAMSLTDNYILDFDSNGISFEYNDYFKVKRSKNAVKFPDDIFTISDYKLLLKKSSYLNSESYKLGSAVNYNNDRLFAFYLIDCPNNLYFQLTVINPNDIKSVDSKTLTIIEEQENYDDRNGLKDLLTPLTVTYISNKTEQINDFVINSIIIDSDNRKVIINFDIKHQEFEANYNYETRYREVIVNNLDNINFNSRQENLTFSFITYLGKEYSNIDSYNIFVTRDNTSLSENDSLGKGNIDITLELFDETYSISFVNQDPTLTLTSLLNLNNIYIQVNNHLTYNDILDTIQYIYNDIHDEEINLTYTGITQADPEGRQISYNNLDFKFYINDTIVENVDLSNPIPVNNYKLEVNYKGATGIFLFLVKTNEEISV